MEIDKIVCADALAFVKSLPNGSVDCVMTDPPYILADVGKCSGNLSNSFSDAVLKDELSCGMPIEMLYEFCRVLQPRHKSMFIWCNKKLLAKLLPWFDSHGFYYEIFVWVKSNPIPLHNHRFFGDKEYCLFAWKGFTLDVDLFHAHTYWVSPTNKADKAKYGHPTCKPVFMLSYLLDFGCPLGGLVLDPYCGSGSTFSACKGHGMHYIGCDVSPHWVSVAIARCGEVPPPVWYQPLLF